MMKIMTQLYGTAFQTNILHSPWIESIKNVSKKKYCNPSPKGCYNLYSGIQVNPNGQLLACCGFAAEYTGLLKDGDFKSYSSSLKFHLANRYNDILRMWIYIDGPRYIYYKLLGKKFSEQTHECEICLKLFTDKKALQEIENLPENIIKYIYYRFNLNKTKE